MLMKISDAATKLNDLFKDSIPELSEWLADRMQHTLLMSVVDLKPVVINVPDIQGKSDEEIKLEVLNQLEKRIGLLLERIQNAKT